MNKISLALASIAAVALAPAAHAAVSINATSLQAITGPDEVANTVTFGYSDSDLSSPTFSEFLTFTNTIGGMYDLALSTSNSNVDFTRAFLVAPGGAEFNLTKLFDQGGALEFWGVSNLNFGPGQFTLNLLGNNRGAGTLDGSVTIVSQMPAVPEPGTWAMMILGFGTVGFAMRRRSATAKASRMRLTYA